MPNTDHNNRERKQQQPDDPPESPKSDYFKVNNVLPQKRLRRQPQSLMQNQIWTQQLEAIYNDRRTTKKNNQKITM